jgi:hypothetical protein
VPCPMINGRLLLPWLVSDGVHAPYFAVITILHQLSLLPESPGSQGPRSALPWMVGVVLSIGTLVFYAMIRLGWKLVFGRA